MKYLTALSLVVLLNTWVLAAEVDFSKVYIDEVEIPPSPTLRIGGVETIESHYDEVAVFNWKLLLGFNPDNATFYVKDAQLQNYFADQLLQQRLRGTIWKGDYKTAKNVYSTELRLISVQNGFIGFPAFFFASNFRKVFKSVHGQNCENKIGDSLPIYPIF